MSTIDEIARTEYGYPDLREVQDEHIKANLNELTEGYAINEFGVITSAGKFEGEHVAALYFYEIYAEGGNYIEAVIQPSGAEMDYFQVTDCDRAHFPEYLKDTELVRCWENESGFFFIQKVTREVMDEHIKEAEESVENDELYRLERRY